MTVPVEFIGYEAVKAMMPPGCCPTYRTLRRMSEHGQFPESLRISPRQPVLWCRRDVAAWIAIKMAPVVGEAVQ
ncbi:MAG TPA: hypothetical protein VGN74_11365 [Brevundimonas sp.]|jgi:hypothetical protein|uniref:helix-turn-helix transcriptional regulator n=1 Tax=Brevundimonas sp. TaxID=1871086 RepID=UPI002E1573DA|nr:hypothetical protein [Brevundimonas sp.]